MALEATAPNLEGLIESSSPVPLDAAEVLVVEAAVLLVVVVMLSNDSCSTCLISWEDSPKCAIAEGVKTHLPRDSS